MELHLEAPASASPEQRYMEWLSRYAQYIQLQGQFSAKRIAFEQQQARWQEKNQAHQMWREDLERVKTELTQRVRLTACPYMF